MCALIHCAFEKNQRLSEMPERPLRKTLHQRHIWRTLQRVFADAANPELLARLPVSAQAIRDELLLAETKLARESSVCLAALPKPKQGSSDKLQQQKVSQKEPLLKPSTPKFAITADRDDVPQLGSTLSSSLVLDDKHDSGTTKTDAEPPCPHLRHAMSDTKPAVPVDQPKVALTQPTAQRPTLRRSRSVTSNLSVAMVS